MKRVFLAGLALLCTFALRAQVIYSLPQTVIVVEVDAVKEVHYAGPYAAYASQMLGINVPQKDEYNAYVKEIRTCARVEADPAARLSAASQAESGLMALSSLGLVSFGTRAEAERSAWSFQREASDADFSKNGLTQPFDTQKQTVYKDVQTDTAITRVAIQKDVKVAKSLEEKAREAADMVLRARSEKFKITIGDTDATYSGEALGSAIAELTRVEQEYLTLFTGYSVQTEETRTFEIIPVKGTETYDVFRLSDSEGLLTPDAKAGKPYYMDVIPTPLGTPRPDESGKAPKGTPVYYRVPAVCSVTLGVGTRPLAKIRIPVYQLGEESLYYIK